MPVATELAIGFVFDVSNAGMALENRLELISRICSGHSRVSNTLQPPIDSPIPQVKLSSPRRNNMSTSVKYRFEKLRSIKR